MYRWIAITLVIVLVFALVGLTYESAYAATITVTTTADELNADGDCSLREAVRAANLDQAVDGCVTGNGADMITLGAQTYPLQLALEEPDDAALTGDLDLAGALTLTGVKGSTTIVATNLFDRVVHVLPGATVQISGVVLTGGYVDLASGGGVLNEGALTLADSAVRQNAATQANGGGIYNGGTLTLLRTEIAGNSAGPRASGAGIYNGGSLTITASVIRNNDGDYATAGGGISNGGTLTMTTTTVSNNSADSSNLGNTAGGGILNSGTATISASTISGNRTTGGGRGAGIYTRGEILLINTTIHGNSADAGSEIGSTGGGIANEGGKVRGSNNTITGNTVAGTSAAPGQGAGIFTEVSSSTKLWNTILAGNTGVGTATSDCVGPFTSNGYNLIQNASGCTITGETTNILGVDPKLGPLQNNGGLTLTRMVLSGSPALDAAHPVLPGADPNACYYTDQRDITRPQDGNGDSVARCDIGAVELVGPAPTPTATRTVTPVPTAPPTPTATRTVTPVPTQTGVPPTPSIGLGDAYLPLVYGYEPPPTPTTPPPTSTIQPTMTTIPPTATSVPPGPTATPAPPPPSYSNCQADPNAGSAPNFPLRIVTVDKSAETVTLRNVSTTTISITGWRICSITGNQLHAVLSGSIAPGETRVITSQAGGPIWNNSSRDDGALYDANGALISYWSDN